MFVPPGADVSDQITLEPAAPTRGAAVAGPLDISTDLRPNQAAVLAIRHPSGALTFHLPVPSTTRGTRGSAEVRFRVALRPTPAAPTTRGLVSKVVKAVVVKVAKIALDRVASLAVPKLVAAIERSIWNKKNLEHGWVRVTKAALEAGKLPAGLPVSPDRSLLFVHGTFSNAEAAFGRLTDTDFFERVKDTYGDRIFAFNHFSLSLTPEENARMLVEALPPHTTAFDVITHSRGGLVLRNLVERSTELGPADGRFKLGRAVLVASPNEGTPLATADRWQETLDWLANVIEVLPDNLFTTGAALVSNGLSWLANHVLVDVPGLHAMDGHGDPIETLQGPPAPPPDAYSALVANYSPSSGIPARLVDAGIDRFFGGANDLVVPTAGGWQVDRAGKPSIPGTRLGCYGPGGNLAADSVTHGSFFERRETVEFLVNALEGRRHRLVDVDPRRPLPERGRVRAATVAPAVPPPAAAPQPDGAAPRGRRRRGALIESQREQLKVSVRVRNGDLQFEPLPLMLGHYVSAELTGTEKAMDGLIGGEMSRALRAGVYPVEVGSHQVFLNHHVDAERAILIPRPQAVVVVGLGPEGELKDGDLSKSVRLAVLAWARHLAERKPEARSFSLASTLMGSGGTGVSAALSARATLRGVLDANEVITDTNASRGKGALWPRCDSVRLIELFLDRATEAWRALDRQREVMPGRFDVGDGVEAGDGGLVRPGESGYRGAEYDFLTVTTTRLMSGEPQITYTLDSRRARSEVRAVQPQSNLVRELVRTASNDQLADRRIGRTLFNLLVPVELEADLAGIGALQMELDETVSDVPWELLDVRHDGAAPNTSDRPWSIRASLLRKLRTRTFRERVVDADASGFVLVIGEPECPPDFQRLEAARQEARAVHQAFKDVLEPEGLADRLEILASEEPLGRGATAEQILNTLYDKTWRVVHIAGHGVPKDKDQPTSGVVLSNGAFLGAAEIKAMRAVPELVFVNCCYLSRSDPAQTLKPYNRAEFAAGVARALIDIGVRCVIAAGWAVEDEAAAVFAKTFYTRLLGSSTFIEAVHDARDATYAHNPRGTTWAAYQCYGDPSWRFRPKPPDANAAEQPASWNRVPSARALKLELERIAVRAKVTSSDPTAGLVELRSLEERYRELWGRTGDVAHGFGAAFFACGDMEGAIRWLEPAVKAPDAKAPIHAAEQLVNARSRFAWESVDRAGRERDRAIATRAALRKERPRPDDATRARADSEVAQAADKLKVKIQSAFKGIALALAELKPLRALASTMERGSLAGAAHKRRALVALAAGRPGDVRRGLGAMRDAYAEALDDGRREKSRTLFYPGLNYLAAALALGAGRRKIALDPRILAEVTASLMRQSSEGADFWSEVSQNRARRVSRHRQTTTRRGGNRAPPAVRGAPWTCDVAALVGLRVRQRGARVGTIRSSGD